MDRSLGSIRLPRFLRAAGWSLVTMKEHYGEQAGQSVVDTEWLSLAGENGWPVLAEDQRIRYRPAERVAIVRYGVRAFCLTSGTLNAEEMAAAYIANQQVIWAQATGEEPGLFAVTRTSIREIDLSS